jgi:SAM-dependent methyltransferase
VGDDSSYGLGLSNTWSDEQRRLAGAERLFDPATLRHLDAIGVTAGMSCLEVAGGGGSIARWMAARVGPEGSVLVTDLDVSRLVGCDLTNVEVRTHDVCADALDDDFDVIHARLLLEHLPSRVEVLEKLVTALRPGGWLLVEDLDLSAWVHLPPDRLMCEPNDFRALYKRLCTASVAMAAASGWDPEFGRDVPVHLVRAGLEDVGAEVCTPLIVGGSVQADFPALSLRQLRPALVDGGYFSDAELGSMIAALASPTTMVAGYAMTSAWGRRSAC